MRLLMAEDDSVIVNGVQAVLEEAGYKLDVALTGPDANQMASVYSYDLIILDLGLPMADGMSVLREIRQTQSSVPILILTARSAVEDKVSGLDAGADDYMTKPFRLKELEARIRSLLRRTHFRNEPETQIGALRFLNSSRQVFVNNKLVDLSVRETDVLELMIMHLGKVVSKQQFIDHLCGWQEALTFNAIEVYISRLRKKLTEHGLRFRTVRGLGYMLEEV